MAELSGKDLEVFAAIMTDDDRFGWFQDSERAEYVGMYQEIQEQFDKVRSTAIEAFRSLHARLRLAYGLDEVNPASMEHAWEILQQIHWGEVTIPAVLLEQMAQLDI
jgi:hypothetical protein